VSLINPVLAQWAAIEVTLASPSKGTFMRGGTLELWQWLCQQAAVEQDLDRLLALTEEINRLLDKKEKRLKKQGNGAGSKITLDKARAAFTVVCPHCSAQLLPADWQRANGEHVRCGWCGGLFVPQTA